MAVGNPAPQITYSSIQGPNIRMSYINSNGFQTLGTYYNNRRSESFPTEWTAEFINPVARPFYNAPDYLLAQMDNRNSWSLKPNPSRHFDAWNVQIRIPKEWRINYSMGQNFMESNGAITATYNLIPTSAGTEVIQSRFGNYQNSTPENLEVDLTMPISLMYSNGRLVVSFSTRREQS